MPSCPTVEELLKDAKSLTKQDGPFQTAWDKSFPDAYHCCEQGGFIYIDFPVPKEIKKVYVSWAPKGSTMNQRTKGPNAAIDLNKPGIKQDNVVLVANFHTHPLSTEVGGNPQPSNSDVRNAYHRGLPGIVISRDGIYSYGPEERTNTKNPKGYGPPDTPGARIKLEREARLGIPSVVKGRQWPEGTGKDKEKDVVSRAVIEEVPQADKVSGDADVVFVDWSDKDVEYGEDLPEHEDPLGASLGAGKPKTD